MSTSSDKVFEEHDIHSISAIESVKTLFSKLCQSLFIKLIILMLSLYFGGLIWFFYSHSTSWTQLLHLCHQSSTEFISTAYYDMSEYSPLFFLTSSRNHHHTIHHHTNDHSINNNVCSLLVIHIIIN